ncbi:MAG: hypothetical protein H7Z75_18590 [Ferruginibacter sp.]|nr:hypothetical protein [Cytophagales bacterium]
MCSKIRWGGLLLPANNAPSFTTRGLQGGRTRVRLVWKGWLTTGERAGPFRLLGQITFELQVAIYLLVTE